MGTATQTLILIITQLVTKVGDEDGRIAAALAEVDAAEKTEAADIAALKQAIAGLPAPFDPTALEARVAALEGAQPAAGPVTVDMAPLEARVAALEDRNAADDAAAVTLAPPPAGVLGGLPDGTGTTALVIDASPLAAPVLGAPYAAQVLASGGVSPYQFSMLSGALAAGLSMAAGGAITGTPTTAGESTFEVQVHDANGAMASASFTVDVADPSAAPGDPAAENAAAIAPAA